jgi:hypothetical protein
MSRMKKNMIVDVVFVNSVMLAEGCERGERSDDQKDGAVVTRLGARVDGNSSPRARN